MYSYVCSKCRAKMVKKEKSYFCPNGHCYDVAKSGYVNLILVNNKHSADPGDNKEMILARVCVMNAGYYDSLADCICSVIENYPHKAVLDTGCGVGSIIGRVHERFPDSVVVGSDISKNAADQAAKKYKDISFCVASSNDLPFEDESFDVLICAFAPVFDREFSRVLKKGGLFIRVVPDVMHLYKLKEQLYDTPRPNEPDCDEPTGFVKKETRKVADDFTAKGEAVSSLVKMTPYYYHTKKEDLERLFAKESLTTNRAFEVRVYQKL